MKNLVRVASLLAAVLLLSACGGGGGSSGTPAGGSSSEKVTTPANLEIYASSPTLSSSRTSSVTFTVVAKDAANRAMPAQPVDFSASSGNLIGAVPTPKTGADGEPITGVSLTPGVDPSNRSIVVRASSGGLSRTITVPVQGTTLAVSGNSAVLSGGTIAFSVKASDSAGSAISGAPLTVTSRLGNPVASVAGFVTNSLGVATFTYSGGTPGLDTLTVSGLGTSASVSVSVSNEDFSFAQPTSGTVVSVGVAQPLSVQLRAAGVPQPGVSVSFATTRGALATATAVTNAAGLATTTLLSSTAGPATVTARSANGAQITLPLTLVATTPATLILQPSLSALTPNPAGSQASQSTLQAMVRDASGNAVTGQTVSFTALQDTSGGTISPGSGVTDANGLVTTQFIPGALATAADGVVIQATVQGTAVSGMTSLTVNNQALFLTIGVGNELANYDIDTYQQQFSLSVVDANGNPVRNREVQLSVRPVRYYKGSLVWASTTSSAGVVTETGPWVRSPAMFFCANEDANRDGFLAASEDINGNGRLDPGLPAVVAPSTVTTNDIGLATFFLRYAEDKAPWVDVEISARTSVGGTESSARFGFQLVGTVTDFNKKDNAPAGTRSPYGLATDCANPL